MTQISDPADKLDAQADGAFGGKHDCNVNRRAGYTDPLGWALKQARKGGTLAAGEGLLIIKHYEALVREAYMEGGRANGPGNSDTDWACSDVRAALRAP